MRGVILAFVAFVALGAGGLIWLDQQRTPVVLDHPVDPKSAKTLAAQKNLPKPEIPVAPTPEPAPPPPPAPKPKALPAAKSVLLNVPFISQAPFGNWADPRQEDGCEEASVLMAMRWRAGKAVIGKQEGLDVILAISQYEVDTYGTHNDTSAADTIERIVKGYFKYDGARLAYNITKEDVMRELSLGNVVIVPANGRKLGNPNFTAPGPLEHMLIIRGYDMATNEFITNDPGTRLGEKYRYNMDRLISAVRDYPTGANVTPSDSAPSAMIVIGK